MAPFFESQCVRLIRDLPDHALRKGMLGAIIVVFDSPTQAYEVEFVAEDGAPLAVVTLSADDITPAEALGEPDSTAYSTPGS